MLKKRSTFGTTKSGETVYLYQIQNNNNMSAYITNYGATLVKLFYKTNQEELDLVLGFDDVSGYEAHTCYFGATIGRNSNRVKDSIIFINEESYLLEANENTTCLHSGPNGYNQRVWEVVAHDENYITLHLFSPDLDQGFPGNLDLYLTYTLSEDNALTIEYKGVTDKDTVLNLTNHTYFNLNGHDSGSVEQHTLWIDADAYTAVVNQTCIQSGKILEVKDTPMDFNTMKEIGRDINTNYEQLQYTGGYDHNYVLDTNYSKKLFAKSSGNISKITMEAYTDMPGVQLYTGNFINKTIGKDQVIYDDRHGFCLETQQFPDATKHSNFPSTIQKAHVPFRTSTTYKFYK